VPEVEPVLPLVLPEVPVLLLMSEPEEPVLLPPGVNAPPVAELAPERPK
jgi:hypothetical protein